MNLTVQPLMNQNVTFNSLKSKSLRLAALALPMAALFSFSGCKGDTFERQKSNESADSITKGEDLSATRYNFDAKTNAYGDKYIDAIQYRVGNNEKQLMLDSLGNVDVEHTYKKDNNGKYIGYETVHHNSNGTGNLSAYRVTGDDINDSTRVTRLYDKDGDIILTDSVVSHKTGGSDNYLTWGNSKLIK